MLSAQRVVQTIREVRDWLRGKPMAEPASVAAAFATDPFKEQRDAITTAKAKLDKDPQNTTNRAKLLFAIAIYRDFSYTHATRIQLQRLSVQNRIRDDFELSRTAVDNDLA